MVFNQKNIIHCYLKEKMEEINPYYFNRVKKEKVLKK